jgi:hypothetical protein
MEESQQSAWKPQKSTNLDRIGFYLDGWADLAEGMANKEAEVQGAVLSQLQGKQMPDITLDPVQGQVGLMGDNKRDYLLAETYPGLKTLVTIRKHGPDLFVGWRSFLKLTINWNAMKWLGGIGAGLGFFLGGIDTGYRSSPSFSFAGFIIYSIIFTMIGAGILSLAGHYLRGDKVYFFLTQPNLFDQEDISALNLSVHSTILRSMDSSGIDVSKLRIKQKFSGGRRGEEL